MLPHPFDFRQFQGKQCGADLTAGTIGAQVDAGGKDGKVIPMGADRCGSPSDVIFTKFVKVTGLAVCDLVVAETENCFLLDRVLCGFPDI